MLFYFFQAHLSKDWQFAQNCERSPVVTVLVIYIVD